MTTRARLVALLTRRLERLFLAEFAGDAMPAVLGEQALRLAQVGAGAVADVVVDEAVTEADIRAAMGRLLGRWHEYDLEARHDSAAATGDDWRAFVEQAAAEGDLAATAALGYACATALDRERLRVREFASTVRDLVHALECGTDPAQMP